MPNLTLTLSADQMKAVRSLMGPSSAPAYVQAHVDDWLQPIVAQLDDAARREVAHAYLKADKQARAKVRADLGLDGE